MHLSADKIKCSVFDNNYNFSYEDFKLLQLCHILSFNSTQLSSTLFLQFGLTGPQTNAKMSANCKLQQFVTLL